MGYIIYVHIYIYNGLSQLCIMYSIMIYLLANYKMGYTVCNAAMFLT